MSAVISCGSARIHGYPFAVGTSRRHKSHFLVEQTVVEPQSVSRLVCCLKPLGRHPGAVILRPHCRRTGERHFCTLHGPPRGKYTQISLRVVSPVRGLLLGPSGSNTVLTMHEQTVKCGNLPGSKPRSISTATAPTLNEEGRVQGVLVFACAFSSNNIAEKTRLQVKGFSCSRVTCAGDGGSYWRSWWTI